MPQCNRCTDKTDYEWFEDHTGRWKLGIKIDVNNYRPHTCTPKNDVLIPNNKRNWIKFNCISCGKETRQNLKLIKTLNLCIECESK